MVISRCRALLVLGWLFALLAGCALNAPVPPTATASPTATGPDFTLPGAAHAMVAQLLAKANSDQALMVEITSSTVLVSVLGANDTPTTWAYRNGDMGQVTSDLAYVDQATFDVDDFNISDVGALFRAASGMAGSEENQSLTIVDYSGGEVMMSVSTLPESRTVFFNPSGSLLTTLDFDTPGGISQGIEEAIGSRLMVYSISVDSEQGAWADFPGDPDTTVRRTRTSKVPVTTVPRAETVDLPLFSASRVHPDAIWKVIEAVRGVGDVKAETRWSVMIDDRDRQGTPRMHFTIGSRVVVTDLLGNVISG